MALINEQMSQPGTCSLGYNSLRFDDEFTRFGLYRNFFDAYAREWQGGNSRWDLIDLVRTASSIRPEGINWPRNEAGELVLEPVVKTSKVFEKIYMDLQEDEMEFSNDDFKNIYYIIIENLNKGSNITVEMFANKVPVSIELEITNILMGEEKYRLHDWQRSNIFPKEKSKTIAQLVNDTILNLRCFLIDQKVNEFKNKTIDSQENKSILDEVLNYSNLKMLLSRKLKRVI